MLTAPHTCLAYIEFKAPPLYPEGIAYNDDTGVFYVSSMYLGRIGIVTKAGKYKPFLETREMISVVGMHYDSTRNRLFACVSDPGFSQKTNKKTQKKLARLLVIDTKRKKVAKRHELHKLVPEGDHFCNDIAILPNGDAYVTDSFSPVIYKVPQKGIASVFVRDDRFAGEGFNLNGIVYHPDNYLLVSKYNDGTLWKITLESTPQITQVTLPKKLEGADGLVFLTNNEVALVQNGSSDQVHKIRSTDGWSSADIVETSEVMPTFPTTAVKNADGVFVLVSRLNELFGGKATQKPTHFKINKLTY
jgi:sugar lactone lactonase YvrE